MKLKTVFQLVLVDEWGRVFGGVSENGKQLEFSEPINAREWIELNAEEYIDKRLKIQEIIVVEEGIEKEIRKE